MFQEKLCVDPKLILGILVCSNECKNLKNLKMMGGGRYLEELRYVMNDLVSFLPIMDLNFSNKNCIYSRLPYICDEVNMSRVEVSSATFDQPLGERSLGIFEEANLKIICNRGVFHMMMSFFGSVENLMKRSGIED